MKAVEYMSIVAVAVVVVAFAAVFTAPNTSEQSAGKYDNFAQDIRRHAQKPI